MVANLLTNAFKYADGPYVVEVSQVPSPRRPLVRIAVLDSGPGVDEGFRPRLFDEFTRAESTREQGTGLGLYVVRSLAEAHGGRADYEPRDGGGSVFSVHLPAAPPVAADRLSGCASDRAAALAVGRRRRRRARPGRSRCAGR